MGKKVIGLSVSCCIADIIAGKVAEEDVEKIIGGTCCHSPAQWDNVIGQYRDRYWRKDPDKAEEIVRRFLAKDMIDQPRTRGEEPPNISNRKWWRDV